MSKAGRRLGFFVGLDRYEVRRCLNANPILRLQISQSQPGCRLEKKQKDV